MHRGNVPCFFQILVILDVVVPSFYTFPTTTETNPVNPFLDRFLERCPVAFGAHVEFRARSALIAIPADETRMLDTRRSVAEPRKVDPVRPLRLLGIAKCLKIRQTARGASASHAVHQLMS